MKRKKWMIPFSFVMLIGASGCSNDNNAAEGNNNGTNNSVNPIGYYSNENHADNHYEFLRDNDGAIPELLDHTMGNEDQVVDSERRRQLQEKDENGHPKNPSTPLAKTDKNFFQRDNRFSTSDVNYHGHLNKKIGNAGSVTDPDVQDSVTDQIRRKVSSIQNVQRIRSVSYGNIVRVSVKLNNSDQADQTKKEIHRAVQSIVKDRDIKVTIDEGTLGRDRNSNNQVEQPEP